MGKPAGITKYSHQKGAQMQLSQNMGPLPSINSVPKCKVPGIRGEARQFVNVESVSAVTGCCRGFEVTVRRLDVLPPKVTARHR
jgi:hypothetical protein